MPRAGASPSSSAAAGRWALSLEAQRASAPDPPGFASVESASSAGVTSSTRTGAQAASALRDIRRKKSWEVARGPLSGIMMTGLMLWMAGSTVHFFSIMMVVMALSGALKGIFGVTSAFSSFSPDLSWVDLLPQMLLYCVLYGVHLAAGVWKLNSLGLLPTTASDWSSLLPVKISQERALGGLLF